MENKVFKLLTILFITVVAYISILAIFYCTQSILGWPIPLFLIMLVFMCTFSIAVNYMINKINPGSIVFLSCTAFVAIALRLLWMLNVNTAAFSDFKGYNDYAVQIANGNPIHPNVLYEIFPFTVGHPVMLSLWYRIFGTGPFAGKLFNILCSLALMFLIYAVAKLAFNQKAAMTASLIFAFWPTQIMYTTVMASEHLFIVFFMLAILLVLTIGKYINGRSVYLIGIPVGILITMAQFLRPISALMFPAVFIYLFIFVKAEGRLIRTLTKKLMVFSAILAAYLVSLTVLSSIVLDYTGVDLSKSSPGFNLLIGTNSEYGGVWNPEDAKIIEEFKYDADKIHSQAMKRALDRIKSRPLEFLELAVFPKIHNMWANEGYGYFWSTYELINDTGFTSYMKSNTTLIYSTYQVYYILFLLAALAGGIFAFRNKTESISLFMLILLALVSAHMLLEVQGRYAFPAMPILIAMAGYGVNSIREMAVKHIFQLQDKNSVKI